MATRLALILGLTVCATACRAPATTPDTPPPTAISAEPCRFTTRPATVRTHGGATLQVWEFVVGASHLGTRVLPADSAYAEYRARIERAGADQVRPRQLVPAGEEARESWRRELHNVELAYSGDAGTLRPIACLEALAFAHQNTRVSQLARPTEFIASVLTRQDGDRQRLRVYLGAGDELFPPREVYGFDLVERDVADGWTYRAMLHNHTVQRHGGHLTLGVPAPSVSDVQLLRSLAETHGLERAWITNGLYTLDLSADDLDAYLGPE